jgi:hypothetical protein
MASDKQTKNKRFGPEFDKERGETSLSVLYSAVNTGMVSLKPVRECDIGKSFAGIQGRADYGGTK